MRLVNHSYTLIEVEISEGLGGGSQQEASSKPPPIANVHWHFQRIWCYVANGSLVIFVHVF